MSTLTVQPTQYSLTVTEDGLGIVSVGVQGPAGPAGAAGAAGPNQLLTGQTLWADVDGDDGTAARGDAAKPYLTLTAALADFAAGDVVRVRPGEYADVELTGGVWHFEAGASVVNPSVGGGDAVIFRFAAGTHRIYGRGEIVNDWSNPVLCTDAGSDWLIECEAITSRAAPYPAVIQISVGASTGEVRGATLSAVDAGYATVVMAGDGTLTLDRCRIEAPAAAPAVAQEAGTLVLRDCVITGTPFQNGSVVHVEGTLTLDTAPDPSVTITGGTVVVTGGAAPVVGSDGAVTAAGYASPLNVRPSGGTGTTDLVLSTDGTTATVRNKSTGGVRLRNAADTVTTLAVDDSGNLTMASNATLTVPYIVQNGNLRFVTGQFQFTGSSSSFVGAGLASFSGDLTLLGAPIRLRNNSNAATVATFTPGTGVQFEAPLGFTQSAAPATTTNTAHVYAKDVAGTAEVFVRDEAGNETQVSPHAMDGPAGLYDAGGEDPMPHVVKEANYFLGGVRYLNLSRACYLLEQLLKAIASGKTLAQMAAFLNARGAGFIDCYRVETFAAHNQRIGSALAVLGWAAEQDRLQAEYDAARAAELAAHDDWAAADPATRGVEPAVRPAADIRKPVPAWLAARGVT